MLEFRNVSKNFGNVKVLENFSLSLERQSIGLIGPNGAGKSTILKLLSTLLDPDTGEILYKGEAVHTDRVGWKRRIGVVPEYPELFQNLTIEEHLLISAGIYKIQNSKKLIDHYLEFFRLTPYRDTFCHACSQGMKKKLSLILAVLHDPEILILDEPFNGLDMYGINSLKKTIAEYSRKEKIVLLTTHLFDITERIVDSVVMINKGELIFNKSLEKILQSYATLEDCYFDRTP